MLIKVQLTDEIGVSCDDCQDPTFIDLSDSKSDPDREEGGDNPKHGDQFCGGQEEGFACWYDKTSIDRQRKRVFKRERFKRERFKREREIQERERFKRERGQEREEDSLNDEDV